MSAFGWGPEPEDIDEQNARAKEAREEDRRRKENEESDVDKMGFFERMRYNWAHRHDDVEPEKDRTPNRRMSDHYSDGSPMD